MSFLDTVYARAKAAGKRLAVPECTNEIMMRAAYKIVEDGLGQATFVGKTAEIEAVAKKCGVDLSKVQIADVEDEVYKEAILEAYMAKGMTFMSRKSVKARMVNPLYMALVMEAVGDVDATFAGLDSTTGEVVMAASAIIGLAPGVATASCFFAVEMKKFDDKENYMIAMVDGGVCVDPTPEQLAGIAISCSETYQILSGQEARCAMLSHSTLGSASGPGVAKVVKAVEIAKELRPDLKIDGEFQVDAALRERVAKKKVKRDSDVAGKANVLVFPNIEACNIGSKMVQMTADCTPYGPLLQGFKMPVCDCSRSDTEDILYNNMACSLVLATVDR